MTIPKVSIIIPAYNEENYILKTIKSIHNQNSKNYEIIVVCNGCNDRTVELAKPYARVIEIDHPNIAEARNEGAKIAEGEKLLFLDADTRLEDPDLLTKVENSRAAIGTCFGKPNSNAFQYRVFLGVKNILTYVGFVNGMTFCDKTIFYKINGYDKSKVPMENHYMIKEARKYGDFKVVSSYVTTSMRRYEQNGMLWQMTYWCKQLFKRNDDEYRPIR